MKTLMIITVLLMNLISHNVYANDCMEDAMMDAQQDAEANFCSPNADCFQAYIDEAEAICQGQE